MSSTWTSADLTALEAAIKTGALEVEYSSGRVRYRSLNEMLQLRNLMRQELGLTAKVSRVNPKTSKGL